MRQKNGQLLIYLGMGFHPLPPGKEAVVALWKLDKLHSSYAAAGMNKGTTHFTNTFCKYGGMQAEMGACQQTVQLCFRSSYGLCYQPVCRGHAGDINLGADMDGYDVNNTFRSSVEGYVKMLQGLKAKTYGACDEMHGSSVAIRGVLKDIGAVVSQPLDLTLPAF
jgi:hypothetical protein